MAQRKLNPRQEAFIHYYIQTGNAVQSYLQAGYVCNYSSAGARANHLLKNVKIQQEINRLRNEEFKKNVASSEEVMDFFSRVMRGEVKDQFGLETSVADRIKAGQELAKRTIDIDNKKLGLGDNVLEIKLDWSRPQIDTAGPAEVVEAEYEVVE